MEDATRAVDDPRPPLWVGHVVLHASQLEKSAAFMRAIGMRPIHQGPTVAIFELRGGTHLIIVPKPDAAPGDASFDLMVEDLHAAHRRFTQLGLSPTPIESLTTNDHELFRVREPSGQLITFYSNHVSGRPV
jgi:Glyoxalase/Bleomycin resistance protein/Dioxygenase superfamily